MSSLLTTKNLTLKLGSLDKPVTAVDHVSITIAEGETFALLGESGCGKSMTALSIMRLLPKSARITEGEVLLDGESLLDLTEAEMRQRRGGRIAMIFQEPMTSLNPVMTVGEQIAESIRIHQKLEEAKVKQQVFELMDDVGIPDVERRFNEYPHQLSGGIKQRIMIAMALAGEPELLIADEPTTALDVTIQAQVLALLKELQERRKMSVLLITHDLGVVAEVADRVAVMYAGQIIETSDIQSFYRQPLHPYSQKLFNSLPDAKKRGKQLSVIDGMVPALDQQFIGCRFVDRCVHAEPRCKDTFPPWVGEADEGYRCHLTDTTSLPALEAAVMDESGAVQMTSTDTVLKSEDLKVHFPIKQGVFRRTVGYVKAVDGVSLSLVPGKTVALVGESGCGKTTVGKGLLQLIPPTSGVVEFDDIELTSLSSRELRRKRKDFQIIFQDPASSMNPRMLVGDIVAEGIVAQKLANNKQHKQEQVARLLKQVGLSEDVTLRYPHEFSGGQRQRICIARALAVSPRLIVCDEPTSALDVSVQAQVLNLLKSLQNELNLAYLFITHDISVVSYLAHEVAVMYLGRIVEQGSVDQVLTNPLHPYTEALLSAVPVAEPGNTKQRIILTGDMPSPANPPGGCHFHPRCPKVMDACKHQYPSVRSPENGHQVSCLLYQD